MVTTIDGRAQHEGTAEGLGSRTDRRLMRMYRAAFDAVGSGVGTLRATGVWLRVGDELAARRLAAGRPPNPVGVLIGGSGPIPTDTGWFDGDEPRILVVGRDNPLEAAPSGTRAPPRAGVAARPGLGAAAPGRARDHLAPAGGRASPQRRLPRRGPDRRGVLDDRRPSRRHRCAASMIAPLPGARALRPGRLVSVHRHDDELFLRYRFGAGG